MGKQILLWAGNQFLCVHSTQHSIPILDEFILHIGAAFVLHAFCGQSYESLRMVSIDTE